MTWLGKHVFKRLRGLRKETKPIAEDANRG